MTIDWSGLNLNQKSDLLKPPFWTWSLSLLGSHDTRPRILPVRLVSRLLSVRLVELCRRGTSRAEFVLQVYVLRVTSVFWASRLLSVDLLVAAWSGRSRRRAS